MSSGRSWVALRAPCGGIAALAGRRADACRDGRAVGFAAARGLSSAPRRGMVRAVRMRATPLLMLCSLLLGAGAAPAGERAAVSDGAPITAAQAQALFDRLRPLAEADGCTLARFDTSRFRIGVGLATAAGTEHALALSTAAARGAGVRRAGNWSLAAPAALERDCPATLAAIERVLGGTAAPGLPAWWTAALPSPYAVLQATFVALLIGTLAVLWREWRQRRPPAAAVLGLAAASLAALVLRLVLSPRAFLHEYYHIAETVPAYLSGELGPEYGRAGPALFRLLGALLGRPDDVEVIFLTTALVSALAVPAVALLDLALFGSWPRALCAAVLLAVLPQHLRFSAAEDLFVIALTLALWTLALFALYLRTRRAADALLVALALSLAMQARPEMVFLPAVLLGLLALVRPRDWPALVAAPALVALAVAAVLLVPRLWQLLAVLDAGAGPPLAPPDPAAYLRALVLLDAAVTPAVFWLLLALGAVWSAVRAPGLLAWVALVHAGFTVFALSLFDNPPYNVRSQTLPNAFLVLIAAGCAPLWLAPWGRRRGAGLATGAAALAALAAGVVVATRDFVTELRDQQLEWEFLRRAVPQLPARATLLAAADMGGRNLNAFPEFLLRQAGKEMRLIEVRRAGADGAPWPAPDGELLFYQGMYCYFAFHDDPPPEPMAAPCLRVAEHYRLEPLLVDDLDTRGYSWLRYTNDGRGPFRVGFYRLAAPQAP